MAVLPICCLLVTVGFVFSDTPCGIIDHVIHIGIDGLNPLCIENCTSGGANIAVRLVKQGSSTFVNARTTIETVSAPGWTANLCSMTSVTSGVHSNAWVPPWTPFNATPAITPVTGLDQPLPTVFSVLKSRNKNIQTAMIYEWHWLAYLGNTSIPGSVDYEFDATKANCTGNCILKEALSYLNNVIDRRRPSYTFIYFGSVDSAGHAHGWCSPSYEEEVGRVDIQIGNILDVVEERLTSHSTLVMLSSDHGGKPGDHNHGYATDECLHVPLILKGPGIRKNHHISSAVMNLDLVPTALHMMGVRPHWAWEGKVIKEALDLSDKHQCARGEL